MGYDTAAVADAVDDAFIARLATLVERVGSASALARKAGISHSGLSRYAAGGDPSRKVLVALARAADVSLAWLATGAGGMTPVSQPALPTSTLRLIRYLPQSSLPDGDVVDAGGEKDQDFTAQAFCFRWLSSCGLDSARLRAFEVRGDSMAPTLGAGSVVLIDTQARSIEDDRIYLMRDSGHVLIRRLQVEIGGQVRALADNPLHREFTTRFDGLDLLGRVVWCGSML